MKDGRIESKVITVSTRAFMVHEGKNEKFVRKATRVGKRSLAVVIPAEIVDELHIRERQKFVIERRGQEIVMKDWKR